MDELSLRARHAFAPRSSCASRWLFCPSSHAISRSQMRKWKLLVQPRPQPWRGRTKVACWIFALQVCVCYHYSWSRCRKWQKDLLLFRMLMCVAADIHICTGDRWFLCSESTEAILNTCVLSSPHVLPMDGVRPRSPVHPLSLACAWYMQAL